MHSWMMERTERCVCMMPMCSGPAGDGSDEKKMKGSSRLCGRLLEVERVSVHVGVCRRCQRRLHSRFCQGYMLLCENTATDAALEHSLHEAFQLTWRQMVGDLDDAQRQGGNHSKAICTQHERA